MLYYALDVHLAGMHGYVPLLVCTHMYVSHSFVISICTHAHGMIDELLMTDGGSPNNHLLAIRSPSP